MDYFKRNKWIFIFSIIALLVFPVSIILIFGNKIELNPIKSFNDYMGFLGSIISSLLAVIVGFNLVNIFWEQKNKKEKIQFLTTTFLNNIKDIQPWIYELGTLQAEKNADREQFNTGQKRMQLNIEKIKNANLIISYLGNGFEFDVPNNLLPSITEYRRDVVPLINNLTSYQLDRVPQGDQEFADCIAGIGQTIESIIQKLESGRNNNVSTN